MKVRFCRKCNSCGLKGLCYECYKNGEKHFLGYPVCDENEYAEIFQKFYWAATLLTFVRSKSFVLKSASCVTFFSERLEPNIPQSPWTSSTEKHGGQLKSFSVWSENNEPEQSLPKKYAQSTRCKLFFHHRSCRSEASRRKRENSKIWSQRSIARNMWYSFNKGLNRARLSLLCFSHGFNDLICYMSDLFLPNGRRKFRKNKANSVERHNHFGLQKYCWDIIYSANL